ncbi:response regulator [Planctobacterium marinum]|uniref:Transcriptional regulator n=1 Tax=Planctobacterium marinum TaxID=1631968 RepID=A0AA48HT14_9ALTE|nr:transcriptional regulator [Planctobacterium marinum]
MTMKKSYSTGEIAAFCDVTLRTVIRWIDRGSLKAYKLPGRGNNRVTAESLMEFLQEYQMPIPAELEPLQQKEAKPTDNTVSDNSEEDNRRILICDDEKPYADAIRRLLRRHGYETRVAYSGFEAGTELMLFKPALITLDLSMPGMSGFEVVSFIRERESLKDIKILVISALPKDDLSKAWLLGADEALSKPFDNEHLLKTVSDLLVEDTQNIRR